MQRTAWHEWEVCVKDGSHRHFHHLRGRQVGVAHGDAADGGIGEISDACAGLDFLQTVNPNASSQWVLGYSFGAYVGMQVLMRRPEMGGFVSMTAA
jgi:alpha/beta superfamily hydrolase